MSKCAFHPGDIARVGTVAVCLIAGVQSARAQNLFDAPAAAKAAAIVAPAESLNATPQRAANGVAAGLRPSGLLDVRYTLSHGMTQSLVRPAAYSPFTRSNAVERFDAPDRARPLWKTNRKAAILTPIGTNVAYAAVVSSNYAIAAHGGGTR